MSRLRYGMVGGGPEALIGDGHRKALNLDGKAMLVAGCFSRSHEKTLATGKELEIAPDRCYQTYEEMAEKEGQREDGIEFVVIATPNVSHFDICKAFMKAGIHIACDKPLCLTVEQADGLVALAEETGVLFLVTYTYMGHGTAKHVRNMIQAGKLGKIRMVMAEYPQGWLAEEDNWGGKQGWRCDPAQSGGTNCLGDLGTHVENAVSTMTGLKINRLLAKMDKLVSGRVLDDNDCVLLEYEGGATGMYWTSQVAVGHDNGLFVRIYGENGSIQWREGQAETVIVSSRDGVLTEHHRGHGTKVGMDTSYDRLPAGHVEGWFGAMSNLYRSFMQCIEARKNNTFDPSMIDYPTVEDGARGIHFVQACLRSTENGNTWETL